MKDLAPTIYRQRLVVEGLVDYEIGDDMVKYWLEALSEDLKMVTLIDPVTHRSDQYGWAGWIHWETSGAHFYAWNDPQFFSVDIYTCKAFDVETALKTVKEVLDPIEMVHKEF